MSLGKLAKKSRVFRWLWNEEAKATACRLRKLPKLSANDIFLIYKENKKERLQSHI
jgi:hypothetical protein